MALEQATIATLKRLKLVDLRVGGTRIVSLGGGESITAQVTTSREYGQGTVLTTNAAGYDANRKIWFTDYTMPSTPQTIFVHWTVIKAGITEHFLSEIRVVR